MEIPIFKSKIVLYDYQAQAFSLIQEAFKTRNSILVVMATGLGKTILSAFFAQTELARKKRGLFLCHENDILDQALEEYRLVLGPEADLKKFYGTSKDWNADNAEVLFASFQSFSEWCQAFDKNHFDFIIVDESHHGQAPTYKEVINYFTPKKLFGMTATPNREDEKDIREIFGDEVVNYTLEEAIAKGWLTNVEYRILNDGISTKKLKKIMKSVLEEGERITIKQLNETIFVDLRDEEIAENILNCSGNSKKTIIFCEGADHVDNFAKFLPNSAAFHYRIPDVRNKQALQDFRDGKIQFILSINKFNEGIDIPDAELIIFLRATDSETIFRQQLGRGLRKNEGKEKVIILDFVANVERLIALKEFGKNIRKHGGQGFDLTKKKFYLVGENYNLIFNDELVDLLEVLDRLNVEFYKTWQEASAVAIGLRLRSILQYGSSYKIDSKLPIVPWNYYKDYPGHDVFFDREIKEFYETWQEASKVAIELKIKTMRKYFKAYKADPKLPACPSVYYKNYPGDSIFFGRKVKKFYKTWQKASAMTIILGLKNTKQYKNGYAVNPRLPSRPCDFYKDYPGHDIFFGRKAKKFYKTWQEASAVAITLGFKDTERYAKGYKVDPKLPSRPHGFYKDYPGHDIFFGREIKYKTWQEASAAAIALGLRDTQQYRKKYQADPKLISNPREYYKDYPGYKIFFGKKPEK